MIKYDYKINYDLIFDSGLKIGSSTFGSCDATSIENVADQAERYLKLIEKNAVPEKIYIWESAKPDQDPIYFTL